MCRHSKFQSDAIYTLCFFEKPIYQLQIHIICMAYESSRATNLKLQDLRPDKLSLNRLSDSKSVCKLLNSLGSSPPSDSISIHHEVYAEMLGIIDIFNFLKLKLCFPSTFNMKLGNSSMKLKTTHPNKTIVDTLHIHYIYMHYMQYRYLYIYCIVDISWYMVYLHHIILLGIAPSIFCAAKVFSSWQLLGIRLAHLKSI